MKVRGSISGFNDSIWGKITGNIQNQKDLIELIGNHVSSIMTHISNIVFAIQQEEADRKKSDAELITKINDVDKKADSNYDLLLADLTNHKQQNEEEFASEKAERIKSIEDEKAERIAVDNTILGTLNDEINRSSTADTEFFNKLTEESKTREEENSALYQKIESTKKELQSNIDSTTNNMTTSINNLTTLLENKIQVNELEEEIIVN